MSSSGSSLAVNKSTASAACTDHCIGTEKWWVEGIDCQSFFEVELSKNKLLLLVVHHSYTIPARTRRQILQIIEVGKGKGKCIYTAHLL